MPCEPGRRSWADLGARHGATPWSVLASLLLHGGLLTLALTFVALRPLDEPPPPLVVDVVELPPALEHGNARAAPAQPPQDALPATPSAPAPPPPAEVPVPAEAAAVEPLPAPPVPAEPPSPVAATPAQPSAPPRLVQGSSTEVDRYLGLVWQAVAAHRDYPASAMRRNIEGTIVVRAVVAGDGRLVEASIVQGGPELLAAAALKAVQSAAPFPPLPPSLQAERGIVEVPISYRLQ